MLMLRRPKSLSSCISRFIIRPHFLHNCTKYSHGYNTRNEDEEDDKYRKRKENQEGYLHLYKSRGQHILTNQGVLDSIIHQSDIKPTDTVLEIGPGTGNLTLKLLEVAKHVVAVEIDKRMIEILNKRVVEHGFQGKLTVICKDALKTEFPVFDLVVANIPYGISSPLLAKLVFGASTFRCATLLLQKEFARRLLANPGDSDYNRLAVNVKLVSEVKFVMDVSKRDFMPCPKVDSSVVKIYPKDEIPEVDLDEWGAFTRTCFNKKNKTLGATFKQKKKVMELYKLFEGKGSSEENSVEYCNYDCCDDGNKEDEEVSDEGDCDSFSGLESRLSIFKDKIIVVLKSGGFEDKRPSKLSNEELLKLLSLFNQAGINFHDQLLVFVLVSREKLEAFLLRSLEGGGFISDGVLAQDMQQASSFWHIREGIAEALMKAGGVYKYDSSLPIEKMYNLVEEMRTRLGPAASPLGDGNLHLNISTPQYDYTILAQIEPFVYEWASKHHGTISAEHGLGLMKANSLKQWYNEENSMNTLEYLACKIYFLDYI